MNAEIAPPDRRDSGSTGERRSGSRVKRSRLPKREESNGDGLDRKQLLAALLDFKRAVRSTSVIPSTGKA